MDDNIHTPAFIFFPGGCLRPPLENEEELLQSWRGINHPENRMYLMRRYPQTISQQREWLSKPGTAHNIALVIEYEGTAVGTMGLHGIDFIHGHATTGAVLWEQKYWNLGIGTKAKMCFLDHCFNMLNLRIVYSKVIEFNGRSTCYSKKCGYTEVARLKNHLRYGNTLVDEVTLAVTRNEWEPLWKTFRQEHAIDSLEEMLERHRWINRTKD